MRIKEELKIIEREQARLAKRKQALAVKLEEAKKAEKKLDELVKKSGFKNPRDLILALMDKYGISRISVKGATKAAAAADKPAKKAGKTTRRKRTKVTAELRDSIKQALAAGESKNAVSKQFNISYIVVGKVAKGAYDEL